MRSTVILWKFCNYKLSFPWFDFCTTSIIKDWPRKSSPLLDHGILFNKTWKEHSLKLTASSPLKIGPLPQNSESYHLPSINFQVQTAVTFREAVEWVNLNQPPDPSSASTCPVKVVNPAASWSAAAGSQQLLPWWPEWKLRRLEQINGIHAMTVTNILPVGSMGLVYLPNIYHRNQPNVGKWEKQ